MTKLLSNEKTLPLTVDNMGFLLDRMGRDCHDLQFLRELTQNAIEAIQRTDDKKGEIVWDVDWNFLDLEGIYKLCIIDTGDGMTGPEMEKYINQLSSSGSEQSFAGNYGVGAKIAAATRNHAGLLYLSWKAGKGAMIHLWRDPETEQYGLKQFEVGDGTFAYYGEVEDDVKPAIIKDHGTMIVLFGNSEEADTMQAPEGARTPSSWVARYLNTRYFRFPDGITIKAREGWRRPRSDNNTNILRTVTGQSQYLEKYSSASGTLNLDNAVAHWWIIREDITTSQYSGALESSGHIAALYKNELYEMATSRTGTVRLQEFGVILGHSRVVIYIEPQLGEMKFITTNTARTQLLINNEPLPWAEWAAEFRANMPEEIEALIEQVAAGTSSSDHSQSIRERLKQISDLFKLSRYKPSPAGSLNIDDERMVRGGKPNSDDKTPPLHGEGRSGGKGGTAGGVYSAFLKKDGVPGQEIKPDVFPEVRWISVTDKSRVAGDLEDRAARFFIDQNLLLINKDFRVFGDMINKWCKEYEGFPAVADIVGDVVRSWFEQALVETVMGVQQLQNAREWSVEDVEKSLSEESLTSAVMQRYHVNNQVHRELATKLGKKQ